MAEENNAVKAAGPEGVPERPAAPGEVPPEPRILFYVISFLVPIAGIVIGAIYLSKPDPDNKEFGKYCLIAALVNFAIGISIGLCVVAFYVCFFLGYIAFVLGLIGVAAGGGMSSLSSLPVAF
ncbi:MAG: hypothetical protein PVH29_05965 [Candidatus Zixiibacteriota bacterium]|jgi:hypothetical protein